MSEDNKSILQRFDTRTPHEKTTDVEFKKRSDIPRKYSNQKHKVYVTIKQEYPGLNQELTRELELTEGEPLEMINMRHIGMGEITVTPTRVESPYEKLYEEELGKHEQTKEEVNRLSVALSKAYQLLEKYLELVDGYEAQNNGELKELANRKSEILQVMNK